MTGRLISPVVRVTFAACFALSLLAGVARANDANGTGGASAAGDRPQVRSVRCDTGAPGRCTPGGFMAVRGDHLDEVGTVVFLGAAGRADDRRARPRRRSDHRVLVRVPTRAGSGPVRAVSARGTASRAVRVIVVPVAQPLAVTPDTGVFPIQGKYSFGTEVNRFGGGRGHQGQDVFASCGTPIVAALGGEVTASAWQDAAGNYVVITSADGRSQAYMHMLERSTLHKGDQVRSGASVGRVGETGRASGCHLHFELWTAPGWYAGGSPIDPLPTLKGWAAAA